MSWPHTPDTAPGRLCRAHDLDRAMKRKACGTCGGGCSAPQACEQPERAEAPFVFPLEPILSRHPWLGPVLVTCVVIVWTCLDAYLESAP